jgi:alkyl sulfatase BDS1-like metallo-beta-lactamase superfamily hydrolase
VNKPALTLLTIITTMTLASCDSGNNQGATDASKYTARTNSNVTAILPFENESDFAEARRGLIASAESLVVKNAANGMTWDRTAYNFIEGEAPASVNPSLWRQASLNNMHGLFKVTDGIYQLRGFDLANMSLIESKSGWIIVDPLTTTETARTALAFARKHLGNKPVIAILFTHSHIDHFGGVQGILESSQGEGIGSDGAEVPIIAPAGFMEEATSENIIAGIAMGRRAMYMYGKRLPRSAHGHIDSGLGKEPALGDFGIAKPTQLIRESNETLSIDGVQFVFQIASGSEAPAEFTFYLPDYNAFCGAEMVSRTMHNLYTLRGAKVRDGLLWSNLIEESMTLFPQTEIYFGSHHWPIWGAEKIRTFLTEQRDTYKFIHDQSVRLLNAGHTPEEIAEMIKLPASLSTSFSTRGYYGTLKHNAKAVYQGYLGWYDGNPANLDPLPASQTAARYVDLMGGADEVFEQAEEAFEDGDYRWAAELLNKLVFADADNEDARQLLAKTYDQLGYQSESAPWRDIYLTGAYELRHGNPEEGIKISFMEGVLQQTPVEKFFDSMAVRLNGPDAEGVKSLINITFTDLQETHVLQIVNSVLHHRKQAADPKATATLKLTNPMFIKLAIGKAGLKDLLFSEDIQYEGSKLDLISFFSLFDKPTGTFSIVTP